MARQQSTSEATLRSVNTALGKIAIVFSAEGIVRIDLVHEGRQRDRGSRQGALPVGKKAEMLVRRYAAGEKVIFDLPLDLGRATGFQKAVWKATASIPYGETRSYGWIAKRINRPGAARAVGQALGTNPVPIIIPCHRVISSSGGLGGFSGGLGMKKKLLELEQAHIVEDTRSRRLKRRGSGDREPSRR